MEIAEALDLVVARTGHRRFRDLCDPAHPDFDPGYPALVLQMASGDPPPAPAPDPDPAPRVPDIPLAGDLVAAIATRIGADRLAALWERWTGQPCGCAERRDRLNRATEMLLKWLAPAGGSG